MVQWLITGEPLPEADRLLLTADGQGFQLDDVGNVLGGIRTNYVDAPVAVLSGLGQTGESFCRIFGTTRLFDDSELAELYPTHEAFVSQYHACVDRLLAGGYLLEPEAEEARAAAAASNIGAS